MSKMIKLLTLTVALVLALSGCKMIAVDTAKDDGTVVAEYKGGTILKGEAMTEYNAIVQTYQAYGYGDALEDKEFVADLKNQVLDYMTTDRITQAKAKEFGVDAIPEEKRQELIQSASDQYNEMLTMYRASFEQEGMTEEEAIAATKAGLEAQMGVNEELMKNYELSDYKDKLLIDHVTKDVAVTDEDLKKIYDEKVANDQQTYTEDPGAYDSAVTYGTPAMWAPEGVRRVKHILVKGDSTLLAQQMDLDDQLSAVTLAIEDKTAPAEDATDADLDLSIENGDATVTETEEAAAEAAVGGATVDNSGAEPVVTEPEPTTVAAAVPTAEPTVEPTTEPTAEPTVEPTAEPTAEPTVEPVEEPAIEADADALDLTDDAALLDIEAPAADLIDFEEPDYDAMTLDELNAKKAELEKQLEDVKAQVKASLEPKVAEVQAKLDAGEDFMALMAQYGEDPGMKSEPAMTEGYVVSANSTMWDPAFKDGAMALQKVGDVSGPVYGQNGCHFIKYDSDVKAGPVDFDSVKESLREEALEAKKTEVYDAAVQQWTTEAEVKLYPERL